MGWFNFLKPLRNLWPRTFRHKCSNILCNKYFILYEFYILIAYESNKNAFLFQHNFYLYNGSWVVFFDIF